MPKRSSSSVRVFYPRYTRDGLVAALRERLPRLAQQLPLVRVVLFGSWAAGRQTVASDVDLLIVYRGPVRDDAFRVARTALEIPGVEPHLYTEDEAAQMQERLARMTAGGIVVYPDPDAGPLVDLPGLATPGGPRDGPPLSPVR
jgi:predicted nucleotidyltransferase